MADAAHFKHVTDSFGRDGGYGERREVSAGGAAGIRNEDVVARWGGEELVVLMQDTDLDGSARIAERIVAAVRACEQDRPTNMPRPARCRAATGRQR